MYVELCKVVLRVKNKRNVQSFTDINEPKFGITEGTGGKKSVVHARQSVKTPDLRLVTNCGSDDAGTDSTKDSSVSLRQFYMEPNNEEIRFEVVPKRE